MGVYFAWSVEFSFASELLIFLVWGGGNWGGGEGGGGGIVIARLLSSEVCP